MSDMLVAGNVDLLGTEAVARLAQDYRLVVAHTPQQVTSACVVDDKTCAYEVARDSEALSRLFDIYSFDTVVYVSGFADAGTGLPGEQDLLVDVTRSACAASVTKFIYLTGLEYAPDARQGWRAEDDAAFSGFSTQTMLRAAQQQELCRCMLEASGCRLVVLHLPFLAEPLAQTGFLTGLFARIAHKEQVCLPFDASDAFDLLSSRDLGALLVQVAEEPHDENASYEASSGYAHTWGDLAACLTACAAAAGSCTCADPAHAVPSPHGPAYPDGLRRMYGWIPFDDALEQVPALYATWLAHRCAEEKPGLIERLRNAVSRLGLLKYVELAVLFVIVQLVNDALGANIYYRFVDLRLLFVVLMGCMHGMRLGLLAALLACASILWSYVGQGSDISSIVMRVENWLPFALYALAGTVCGYVSDKKDADVAFAREEYRVLREKYLFLNEVYTNTVENKSRFKRQIIGFQDSFGRIFAVVQHLDDVLPQKLFLKALEALEDVLHNRSIALYSVDRNQRFCRLMSCSRPMRPRLAKSVDLQQWAMSWDELNRGRVWRNLGLDPALPSYACGSFVDGKLRVIVCVWQAQPDQLDMGYANLIRVMCGLLEMSFKRAEQYTELARSQRCFVGTDVLHEESFDQLVQAQVEMGEKGVADFLLLRFPGLGPEQAQARLVPLLRATDEVGMGVDGCVCALLRQANRDVLPIVSSRFEGAGLAFEVIAG